MIEFEPKGAIFDVDDTLLDNKPHTQGHGLHERSRLAAFRHVGEKYNIQVLKELSVLDNLNGFLTAPVHSLNGAVWHILAQHGLATGDAIDLNHPLHREIVDLKNELHEVILLEEGEEIAGASAFVRALGAQGIGLAIASSAVRRDIDLFLKKTEMSALFDDRRIVSIESITHAKPHPEVFNLAFDSLGLSERDRARVCAFEDDLKGIAAAKAAGLYACAITSRFSRDELLGAAVPPDFIGDSYEAFADYFGVSLAESTPKAD